MINLRDVLKQRMARMGVLLAMGSMALTLGGCATVKPWERGTLAEPAMLPDAYAVDAGLNDHTYFSKESTSGGNAIGGGGCGCN